MSDDLLVHYNRELLNIRRAAAAFASENPRIAGRLRLSEDAIEDPHVGRLIEAFAYLTARVRQKMDDDFPELTNAMLGILYPHLDRPIPSMSILQMDPKQELQDVYTVPAKTLIDTEQVDGERCRYRTAFDVALHPITIRSATLTGRPITAPETTRALNATACLRLTLDVSVPDGSFASHAPQSLRFFLRGQPQLVYPLYELLLNDAIAVAFAEGANDPDPVFLDGSAFSPGGFAEDEGLLPYPQASHLGYRILTEYFAFPEKFLFVDLAFPARERLARKGRTLDVFVYLNRPSPSLERSLTAAAFALGCVPVVNLFPQTAEPITLNQKSPEYRVVPDSRRPQGLEVYSIESVVSIDSDGNQNDVHRFYSVEHAAGADRLKEGRKDEIWWLSRREAAAPENPGSEVYVSFADPDFRASVPADEVLAIETLCLNRNRPERLPFGGGQPQLRMVEPMPMVKSMRLLTAPTSTLRPLFGQGGRWRLISHLSLNHLSLVSDGGIEALREILLLYDFRDSAETRALIDGIVGLSSKSGTARVRSQGQSAFCRGIDVNITFDEPNFSGNGVYLMASVLERFLGLYASVNSFSRLTALVKGRTGILKTWPARAGDRALL
ncbi:type VI secretion system baseplate subunit TssF [Metarhizobium album]|uniref:Type VI secretion system baseplate subunit TssF n=1 Tax=Metarhizobium album TaxID=2182425 RepID=A0A2U2DQT1_9HYPH|nr:type VI secretion system baseplate subunit TssF [Rhizobium album]PWE55651.1 type VI secretion system baseplate subunit TssF [Rhizobium album]